MLCELDKTDYEKVQPLFLPLEFQLSSLAVLGGINPGRCFVDDLADPQTALLFSPEEVFYLAGNSENQDFNHALNQTIFNRSTFDEEALIFGLASDDWVDSLVEIFSPLIPVELPLRHYVCL